MLIVRRCSTEANIVSVLETKFPQIFRMTFSGVLY
jgi:hypothetical protein